MTSTELKELGKSIKEVRNQQNLTQSEVAEKADTSANYFAQIERGEVNPTYTMLRSIAKALKVKLRDLIP